MEGALNTSTNGQRQEEPPDSQSITNSSGPRDSKGWDGKLRVERRTVLSNPETISDPEYSDEDAPPTEKIDADEGLSPSS